MARADFTLSELRHRPWNSESGSSLRQIRRGQRSDIQGRVLRQSRGTQSWQEQLGPQIAKPARESSFPLPYAAKSPGLVGNCCCARESSGNECCEALFQSPRAGQALRKSYCIFQGLAPSLSQVGSRRMGSVAHQEQATRCPGGMGGTVDDVIPQNRLRRSGVDERRDRICPAGKSRRHSGMLIRVVATFGSVLGGPPVHPVVRQRGDSKPFSLTPPLREVPGRNGRGTRAHATPAGIAGVTWSLRNGDPGTYS